MHGESDLSVFDLASPGFEVETAPGVYEPYSAMQMFATSLGLCTASVLASYAEQVGVSIEKLAVRVKWQYAEGPFRIGSIDMQIFWPELPQSRRIAAERAASHCTIHHTLEHSPQLSTRVLIAPEPGLKYEGAREPAPLE